MPINVQPSIVTDPAAVIQRSAQVQNEAAAQAFRNAQVGQQSGQAGMDTAIKSTAALAEQRAKENAQKRAAIQQNFQQAASTMTQLGRDWRKEKLDLSKEQRALDRQTADQKAATFATGLNEIKNATLEAMDENGKLPDDFVQARDSALNSLKTGLDNDDKVAWAKTFGPINDLGVLAVKNSKARLQANQDAVSRGTVLAAKRDAEANANARTVAGTVAVALRPTNTLKGISELSDSIGAIAQDMQTQGLPPQQIADECRRLAGGHLFRMLDGGGQKFYDAYYRNDSNEMFRLLESDETSPMQVDIIQGWSSGMNDNIVGPEGEAQTTGMQEIANRVPDKAKSIMQSDWDTRDITLLSVKLRSEKMRSYSIEPVAAAVHSAADDVEREFGVPSEKIMDGVSRKVYGSVAGKSVQGAPPTRFYGGAQGSAVDERLNMQGMGRPEWHPPMEAPEGEMGPPEPQDPKAKQDQEDMDTLRKYGETPQKKAEALKKVKEAAKRICQSLAENEIFLRNIGGDIASSRRLTDMAQSQESIVSISKSLANQAARGMGDIEKFSAKSDDGFWTNAWRHVSGEHSDDLADIEKQTKTMKGVKGRSGKQMANDMVLAEAIRQGVISRGEAFTIADTEEQKRSLRALLTDKGEKMITPEIRNIVREMRREKYKSKVAAGERLGLPAEQTPLTASE